MDIDNASTYSGQSGDDEDADAETTPLQAIQRFRTVLQRTSLSHEEIVAFREVALQIASDLGERPSGEIPETCDTSSFRNLGADELRLITESVDPCDALCFALTCRKFRDAAFARFPGQATFASDDRVVNDRFKTLLEYYTMNISRFSFAITTLGMPLHVDGLCTAAAGHGAIDVVQEARRRGCAWDANTCAAAAHGGHLSTLQHLRNGGSSERCPWNERTCAAAAGGGHMGVLRWARQRKCPWDSNACANAAANGQLAIFEWLRKKACPVDEASIDEALLNGHEQCFFAAVEHGAPIENGLVACGHVRAPLTRTADFSPLP